MIIEFTRHAERKIRLLDKHGFSLTRSTIENVIVSPDKTERKLTGEQVAQGAISETHVLRVVFNKVDDKIRVITMYPGRRKRYED